MFEKEEYLNHPVWTAVDELDDMLNGDICLESGMRAYVAYLIENLASRKNNTKHYYLGSNQLNELHNNIQRINENLSNYLNNPTSYRQGLISAIQDTYSSIAASWPANNGRATVDVSDKTIQKVIEKTQEQLDQMDESVRDTKTAHDRINELKTEYETNIQVWKDEHNANLQEYVNGFISEKDIILAKKESEMAEVVQSARDSAEQMTGDYENAITKAKADSLEKMNGFLDEAKAILHDLKNTSNEVASKVIADDYRKYARNKAVLAAVYDVLAFVFAVVGIWLVWWFLDAHQVDSSSVNIYKLAIAVATFTISGFLFRRGTTQHKESTTAKRTQLTLAQYRPFIANLNQDVREEITRDIADRVFIKGDIDINSSTLDVFRKKGLAESDIESLAKLLQDVEKIRSSGQHLVQAAKEAQ